MLLYIYIYFRSNVNLYFRKIHFLPLSIRVEKVSVSYVAISVPRKEKQRSRNETARYTTELYAIFSRVVQRNVQACTGASIERVLSITRGSTCGLTVGEEPLEKGTWERVDRLEARFGVLCRKRQKWHRSRLCVPTSDSNRLPGRDSIPRVSLHDWGRQDGWTDEDERRCTVSRGF